MDHSSITRSAFEETTFGIIGSAARTAKGRSKPSRKMRELLEQLHSSTLKVPALSGFCGLPCMVVKRRERVALNTSPTIGNVDLELSSLSLPSACYVVSRWTSSTGKGKAPTVMLQCNADEVAQSASTRQKDLSRNNNCWLDTASTSPSRRPEA